MAQAEKSTKAFRGEVDRTAAAAERLKKVSGRLDETGRSALLAGAAVGAASGQVLKAFTELEDAQAAAKNAFASLDGLDARWESINRQAVKAGDLYPGTTADFINMAGSMKRLGMEAKTIDEGGLAGAAALKVMFGLDPVRAGEQYVQMSRALGIVGRDSMVFADSIQRASYAAGLSLNEIADAMPYMGDKLKRFRIQGTEDAKMILATMGVLKASGLNGTMIGTSIGSALDHIAMIGPKLNHVRGGVAAEAAAAFSRSGVELKFFDGAGQFAGYANFLAQIDKLKSIKSDADRALIAKTYFGEEGARLAETMDLQAFNDMAQKMLQQEQIKKRLERITKTLGNTYEATTGTAKNAAAAWGEKMAPALKELLERANRWLSALGAWTDRHPKLTRFIGLSVLSLAAFLVLVGGSALVLGKLVSGVLMAGKAFQFMVRTGSAIRETATAISICSKYAGGLGKGLLAWSRLQFPWLPKMGLWLRGMWQGLVGALPAVWANVVAAWAWTAAMLANPITWIIAGVVALAAGAYLLIKHWDKVKAFFVKLWTWFRGILAKCPDWLLALVFPVGLIIKHWNLVKAFFVGLWKGIKEGLAPVLQPIAAGFAWLWGKVKAVWAAAAPYFSAAWTVLKVGFQVAVAIIARVWGGVKAIFQKIAPVLKWIGLAFAVLAAPILLPILLIRKYWTPIKAFLAKVGGWFLGLFPSITATGGQVQTMGQKIGKVIAWLITSPFRLLKFQFYDLPRMIAGALASGARKLFDGGANLIKALWNGIKSVASKPVEAMAGIVTKIRRYLPFSPAKDGPLKDIHKIKLVETIAGAIRPEPLVRAMGGAMGGAVAMLRRVASVPLAVATAALPVGAQARPSIHLEFKPTIHVTGNAKPEEVRQLVREELRRGSDDLLRELERAMERRKGRTF